MGLSLFSFMVFIPRLLKLSTFQNFRLQHAKDIVLISIFMLYHHLHLLIKSCTDYCYSSKLESTTNDHDDHLPDQEQVTVSTLSQLPLQSLELEKQIPAMEYCLFLKKTGKDNDQEKECVCIVCMNRIERKHEVRMLCNCCHVFQRACMDSWIGEGKRTCPLCRSKLLGHGGQEEDDHEQVGFGGDLWRVEEMFALFDDDFFMGH
ncbi:hypothetical protein FEM48_Zijuj03G0188000 [Ziziphus jujuba var. spinosa]|uniref:RING-type domain-containing protein n=2 Tax=Ziziphus jujuba TaxID=326968 RepID=A0A978VS04_ZIZJJ|nr:hypothetical protein FEM48_Zijuj03G0188000 [Ziziphus jujuba var. spinosa]